MEAKENDSGKKYFVVTGGTGLIGSQIVKALLEENPDNIIILISRDIKKFERLFHQKESIMHVMGDISNVSTFEKISSRVDYIIHCACETKSWNMYMFPAEVSKGIVSGTFNVLQFAMEKQVKSMVYLSSMEVYGSTDKEIVSEPDLGYLDIFQTRSCYPMGKRMAESLCYSYYQQHCIPVKVARLAQTFGPGTPREDNRVFAQFAGSIIKGEDIVLHTEGSTVGNYVDTEDAVSAILKLLKKGKDGEAYNVANPANCMTVRQMADMAAHEIAKDRIKVTMDIPKDNQYGYPASSRWRLNVEKMMRLGWNPCYSVKEMYERMLDEWK